MLRKHDEHDENGHADDDVLRPDADDVLLHLQITHCERNTKSQPQK